MAAPDGDNEGWSEERAPWWVGVQPRVKLAIQGWGEEKGGRERRMRTRDRRGDGHWLWGATGQRRH